MTGATDKTMRRKANPTSAVNGVLAFMGMALIVCAGVMDSSLQVNEIIKETAAMKDEIMAGGLIPKVDGREYARQLEEDKRLGPHFETKKIILEHREFPKQSSVPSLTIKSNSLLPMLQEELDEELEIQNEFQDFIYQNQFGAGDCQHRRILLSSNRSAMDGFTWELQDLGRMLMAGIATDRTFLVSKTFPSGYAPSHCRNITGRDGGSWTCIFNPITNCTEENSNATDAMKDYEELESASGLSYGIIPFAEGGKSHSRYFDKYYYGADRVVRGPPRMWNKETRYIDVVPKWERRMGRYWIRCQTAHFIWGTIGVADYLKNAMEPRMPEDLVSGKIPYIAMHVRFTDNIFTLSKLFGRDAHTTRDLHTFMEIAQGIRAETGISNIYLATDSQQVVAKLREIDSNSDWTFWIQESVERSEKPDWLWFMDKREAMAPMIATDIEVLRRADHLIGSFQSNVYRFCAEINTAYHAGKYSIHQYRHHTVDLDWYEDP